MNQCPSCSEAIDHLISRRFAVTLYHTVLRDGKLEYSKVHEEDATEIPADWLCPACGQVIAKTEEEAKRICPSALLPSSYS